MGPKILVGLVLILIILLAGSFVSAATTASLGNSRMILRLDTGEVDKQHLLVRNVNDFPITIYLEVEGDLADDVKLEEESFVLQAGGEKRAYFEIEAKDEGTTETKINVFFEPEQGNSVGLAATVIVIASDDDSSKGGGDGVPGTEIGTENLEDENSGFSFEPGAARTLGGRGGVDDKGGSGVIFLFVGTLLLMVFLVLLVVYSSRIKLKKKVSKNE